MKNVILGLLCSLLPFYSFQSIAQETISLKVSSTKSTHPYFLHLQKSKAALREDFVANEELLDLCDVYLVDSILKRKVERHQFFGGGFTRLAGIGWKNVNGKKMKFIGTVKRFSGTRSEAQFTEFDINYDLIAHTKKYIDVIMIANDRRREMGKKVKKKDIDHSKPPFVYPTDTADYKLYRNHVELSPPEDYRPMINDLFYPVLGSKRPETHQNIGEKHPTFGVYGPLVLDCNHNCHAETHPYEWIWWLNLNPDMDEATNEREWVIGLFDAGSNRFPHWTKGDRTGAISIPFILPKGKQKLDIRIDHLGYSFTKGENLSMLPTIPADAKDLNFSERKHVVDAGGKREIVLSNNYPIMEDGINYWFSELNYDDTSGMLSGKLNLGISTETLYMLKVTTVY